MKQCTRCGVVKDLDEYHRMFGQPDGRRPVCKTCRKSDGAAEYQKTRPKRIKYQEGYRAKNRAMLADKQREYLLLHRTRIRLKRREWERLRVATDVNFRLRRRLRARVHSALKASGGAKKAAATMDLIGCSAENLRAHIERQFRPGMSWGNVGRWHIDHIRPCASFDLTDPAQQRACFHYTNLQPLWAADNLRKGAQYLPAA